MKKIFAIAVVASIIFTANSLLAQGKLDRILIFKITDPNTPSASLVGTGMTGFKLTVGEEILVMAKGFDESGNEVAIWPTWKADKELTVSVVEGKSKVARIKAVRAGTGAIFFSAIYIDDSGKKYVGEVMGEVKEKTQ